MAKFLITTQSPLYSGKTVIVCNAETGILFHPSYMLDFRPQASQQNPITIRGPFNHIVELAEEKNGVVTVRSLKDIKDQMAAMHLRTSWVGNVERAYFSEFGKSMYEASARYGFTFKRPPRQPQAPQKQEKERDTIPMGRPAGQQAAPAATQPATRKKGPYSSPGALTQYFSDLRAGRVDYWGLPRGPQDNKWWATPMKRKDTPKTKR